VTPERWQHIKSIAADALEVEPSNRRAFVVEACAADADLLMEVESLLGAEDPTGRFLEPDSPPERIGVYRIIREIGRGGMGTVFEGHRADGQFEQRVAIKIVKRGMDTVAVLRRFFAERRILAMLQHPHIARLFDGGVTTDGRPYFVMEYLEASPITTYCESRDLSAAARVDLFIAVCDAVAYAHSHLVLHRDLKPANVVVDAAGAPKLLDFGIAKLLDDTDPAGALTEIGQRAMTPLFASPEQRRGEPLTTASDVFALGLMLGELVPVASRRGDLGRVMRKALEEEAPRRYTTAGELADDLRRCRQNRPVSARPSGMTYRASKYARRHWRALAAVATAAIVLTAAVANALAQGRRAERHFREVRQLANSFLFEFHDAVANLAGATPARELVVTRALQYLDGLSTESSSDPELQRELAHSYLRVGDAQGLYYESNLGKIAEARASFEKAASLFEPLARAQPSDIAAQTDFAMARLRVASSWQAADPDKAMVLLRDVIQSLGPIVELTDDAHAHTALAQAYAGLAENRLNVPEESIAARHEAVQRFRELSDRTPAVPDADRWLSMNLKRRAALRLNAVRDAAAAAADLAEAAAIDSRRVAREPTNAVAQLDLALGLSYQFVALQQTGDLAGALESLGRALAIRREILRSDPRNVRVRGFLASDETRLDRLIAELRQSGASPALLRQAEALAASR
jgi:eukaryotic-like serine/threonine-protein kinase